MLKLQHSDWRANLVKYFLLKIDFPIMRALEFITGHVIYNLAYTYKFQLKTTLDNLFLFHFYSYVHLLGSWHWPFSQSKHSAKKKNYYCFSGNMMNDFPSITKIFFAKLSYTAMVFCYQNCSDLLWENIVLLEQFIQTVKGQNNF